MRKYSFRFLFGILIGLTAFAQDIEKAADTAHHAGVLLGKLFDGENDTEALGPHAAEACDILALSPFSCMTRIWLAELAGGDAEQRARAATSLVALGDQAASEVRAFRDTHADDEALVARCNQVLLEQKNVTSPATVPVFPPTPAVRFLLSVPELPPEKIAPLEAFYRAALVSGREGSLTLAELTPETLETLLRQTAGLKTATQSLRLWIAREPVETFRTLATEMLTNRFENAFPLLMSRQANLPELLRILSSPGMAEKLGEEEWELLIGAIAESTLGSDVFLTVLDGLENVPEGFTANAHRLMQMSSRHVALGGLFQTRYPVPRNESRDLLRTMVTEKVSYQQWDKFLKQRKLDPMEALYLLSVHSWRGGNFESPTVIHLLEQTDSVSDADLLAFLAGRKPNYFLLALFAIRRPAISDLLRLYIFQGVKEEFSLHRFHLAGNCMQRFKTSVHQPGMFDTEWLAEFEKENPPLFILFLHAPRYRITPELLWEKFRIHEAELMKDHSSFMKHLPVYMLEHGGPDLRKEMLSRFQTPDGELSEADEAKRPDFKATLKLDPAEIEGLLALQARLFHATYRDRKSLNFPGALFSTSFASSHYKDTADFYRQNKEGIAKALTDEVLRPTLLPLLAVCGMDDELRQEDRDFLLDAIQRCVAAYPEPDGVVLGGSFVAILLGAKEDWVVHSFAESLAIPAPGYNFLWKILVLLNGDHDFLLPGLIQVADREDSSMYPLLAMIRIEPEHPEVLKRVQQALYHSDDHDRACHVMEYLTWKGAAPRLDSFSEDRIDWFLRLENENSLYNTGRFVNAFPAGDQGPIVERLRPRLKEVAQGRNIFFTFYELFSTEEWQRRVAEDLFALLASDDPKEYDYAVDELSSFQFFTPRQLRVLAMNINRFENHQNAMNMRPSLMTALCNAGAEAAFLLREIRHHANQGDEHLRPVALRCLAGITDDPAEGQACFDKLVWAFRNEYSWKGNQVRQIARMKGRPETVIPFLREIILAHGTERGKDTRYVQEAIWGLPFQTTSPEVVIPLFQHIWEIGRRNPEHDEVLESMFYTLAHDYPDWIPSFKDLMETTPLRHRVYYGFRKMEEALQKKRDWK